MLVVVSNSFLDQNVVSSRTPAAAAVVPHGKNTPNLVAILPCLLEHGTAGAPITGLRWSGRTTITEELAQLAISVSPNTVARLLHRKVPFLAGQSQTDLHQL